MAGFKSERWPVIDRNAGRLQLGIRNPDDSSPDLMALENDFVQVFLGATTFERELTTKGLLPMHIAAAEALGAPKIHEALSSGYAKLCSGSLSLDDEVKLRVELGGAVLNTAKRFGKARYAQVAARFADRANELPEYIQQAFDWLSE